MDVIHGDCIEEMKKMKENSIDSIVTDPPYGIGFMGEKWDKFTSKQFQDFSYNWGVQALKVLKSGGYCLAFSGTRTYHRMVCGLEDAGFNIKDTIIWCYGSGFPKSLDISKAIDKYYGKEQEVIGRYTDPNGKEYYPTEKSSNPNPMDWDKKGQDRFKITKPNSNDAQKWNGWGSALKPALEPVVVAQKPLIGTYAENVLKYGVGGLNIDKCRIPTIKDNEPRKKWEEYSGKHIYNSVKDEGKTINFVGDKRTSTIADYSNKGRFPSNLLLDEVSAEMLDKQSGNCPTGNITPYTSKIINPDVQFWNKEFFHKNNHKASNGGASRFFYCGKAHKSERNAGLLELPNTELYTKGHGNKEEDNVTKRFRTITKNNITTLKPINIMRYLVRLVTPPNGIVLDPFAGSGTTGIACIIEGFNCTLIEKRKRFANLIIPKRLDYWKDPKNWSILKNHNALPKIKKIKKERENKSLNIWI